MLPDALAMDLAEASQPLLTPQQSLTHARARMEVWWPVGINIEIPEMPPPICCLRNGKVWQDTAKLHVIQAVAAAPARPSALGQY